MSKPLSENIQLTTLPNGLRIVSETVTSVQSVSLGIWTGVGSRDESASVRGISHFIEHMLFKGTPKRTAREIADEIESRGGYLNAFTSKENTCYETRVLADHLPIAMDVLVDMFLNSLLDPEEIEREKRVVLEEIKMYEDSPDDLVHELFDQTLWNAHPLGKPVIGTAKTVAALTRDNITDYMATQYCPNKILVAAAGNLDHEELVSLVQSTLGELKGETPKRKLKRPQASGKSKSIKKRDVEQIHFCIGSDAYSKHDKERYALSILNNVLGGNMSSRLFQEVREKRGLVYSIGSYARTFQDGGFFCVYGGTGPATYQEAQDLTLAEFQKVRTQGITDEELRKAKTQIQGALALSLESMSSRMNRYGEAMLAFGRVIPLEEVLAEYNAVSHESIAEVAAKVLDETRLTITTVGPKS